MTEIRTCREHVAFSLEAAERLGYKAPPRDQLLAERGTEWTERAEIPSHAERTPKMCYRNAAHLALSTPGLTYAEGYAWSVIPIPHAWCVTEDGKVVDPTGDWAESPADYLGITVSDEDLLDLLAKADSYGILDREEIYAGTGVELDEAAARLAALMTEEDG